MNGFGLARKPHSNHRLTAINRWSSKGGSRASQVSNRFPDGGELGLDAFQLFAKIGSVYMRTDVSNFLLGVFHLIGTPSNQPGDLRNVLLHGPMSDIDGDISGANDDEMFSDMNGSLRIRGRPLK